MMSVDNAEPTVQPAGSANFTPKEIINWLREHPGACPICGGDELLIKHQAEAWVRVCTLCMMLGADNTLPGKVACDQIENFIRMLHSQRARLRAQLLEAKKKNYTDYCEYVGLISQNESLRRQIDELNKAVDLLRRKLAESRGEQ
jgi:hypothetical protein